MAHGVASTAGEEERAVWLPPLAGDVIRYKGNAEPTGDLALEQELTKAAKSKTQEYQVCKRYRQRTETQKHSVDRSIRKVSDDSGINPTQVLRSLRESQKLKLGALKKR